MGLPLVLSASMFFGDLKPLLYRDFWQTEAIAREMKAGRFTTTIDETSWPHPGEALSKASTFQDPVGSPFLDLPCYGSINCFVEVGVGWYFMIFCDFVLFLLPLLSNLNGFFSGFNRWALSTYRRSCLWIEPEMSSDLSRVLMLEMVLKQRRWCSFHKADQRIKTELVHPNRRLFKTSWEVVDLILLRIKFKFIQLTKLGLESNSGSWFSRLRDNVCAADVQAYAAGWGSPLNRMQGAGNPDSRQVVSRYGTIFLYQRRALYPSKI